MTRGRHKSYQEPLNISLKCERPMHELMVSLGIGDSIVYSRGAVEYAKDNAAKLTPDQFDIVSHEMRANIKRIQEDLALMERVRFDNSIREEQRKKKKTETRFDERGQAYLVVEAP